MKAISKFKSLLRPRGRAPSILVNNAQAYDTSLASPSHPASEATPEKSTAEYAAHLLREREQFLANIGKANLNHLRSPHHFSSSTPAAAAEPRLLLGIGTGGIDSFGSEADLPAADTVSDSPTAVDFNVYHRAFEEEVERIRRSVSSSMSGSPSSPPSNHSYRTDNRRGREARVQYFKTRLVDSSDGNGDRGERGAGHYKVGDGDGSGAEEAMGGRMTPRSLFATSQLAGGLGMSEGMKFADLVTRAMLEAKSTAADGGGGSGREEGRQATAERQVRD